MPDSESAPLIANLTVLVCQLPGSGAPSTEADGAVLSTFSVVTPNVAPATPEPEIARALTVTVPSGRSVSVVDTGQSPFAPAPFVVASIVASGSVPSVVY